MDVITYPWNMDQYISRVTDFTPTPVTQRLNFAKKNI